MLSTFPTHHHQHHHPFFLTRSYTVSNELLENFLHLPCMYTYVVGLPSKSTTTTTCILHRMISPSCVEESVLVCVCSVCLPQNRRSSSRATTTLISRPYHHHPSVQHVTTIKVSHECTHNKMRYTTDITTEREREKDDLLAK